MIEPAALLAQRQGVAGPARRAVACRLRRGSVLPECAVILPIITLVAFGLIETAGIVALRQTLQVAAYEGLRQATLPHATGDDVRQAAEAILAARQIQDASIHFPHGDIESAAAGTPISIQIIAPTRSNSPLAGRWSVNRHLSARLVTLKE